MKIDWMAILAGWPGMLVAFGLAVLGIARRKLLLALASALLSLPFTLFLLANPNIGLLALIIPTFMFAAAGAVFLEVYTWAWVFLIPVVGFVSWVAVIIIGEG